MALTRLDNETELLQSIASGCSDSFATLFHTYFDQVSAFVLTLTHCPVLTEEIVQEVFTKLWVNRTSLTTVKKIDAYLFIITRNHALTFIRNASNKKAKLAELSYFTEASEEPKIFDDVQPDYEELIDHAVSRLPQRQQEVFLLRRKGYKNPDIALKLDISGASVVKYQQLALKAISQFVKMHILSLILALLFF